MVYRAKISLIIERGKDIINLQNGDQNQLYVNPAKQIDITSGIRLYCFYEKILS
ncbi:MAG: hypothetical protein ACI9AV_002012 [Sediminicola sp.]|jgi:hypothetical protein